MARKASARKARKPSRTTKSKSKSKLRGTKPSGNVKREVKREPTKRAPTKGPQPRKLASKPPSRKPGMVAPAKGTAKPAAKSAPKTAGAGGSQGTLDFQVNSPPAHAGTEPMPKRRSARQGGPDWPGEHLTVGMQAPEFELPSSHGRRIALHELRGKRVILYFYPKDDTPGCTMEACAFRDNLSRIEAKDAVVLGVSLDDELSHQRFAQKYGLTYPLLSDVDAAVSRQYGVYKEKNLYGRSFWGIERTTFVIDREGKVENVFRRVKVEGHADEVLATLAV